ncbi:cytochrome P450 [Amniculicola lignicola CBS 123094]|uniref:Cytochrome P450 n=1 Tax=Amniculicola lignicola CBS 123094 TaxID=1392246 RepID=A0A6A5WV64_9PLEO|nr:cytochrome P450 [Amniculicola lignicola CBS 123094]
MTSTLPLFVLASFAVYLVYIYIIYPLFISPLSKVPAAHPLAAFTPFWIQYHRLGGVEGIEAICKAHTRHGPIIRLSPKELSVSSLEAVQKVYIERGGFAKPKWWAEAFMTFGVHNMVSMQGGIGNKDHADRKRAMGNVYSKSFLMKNEDIIVASKSALGLLGKYLEDASKNKGGVIDVYVFNMAANADFASSYMHGTTNKAEFMADANLFNAYYQSHMDFLKGSQNAVKAKKWLEDYSTQRCKTSDRILEEGKGSTDGILHKQLCSRGLRGDDLASEMLDHFMAASEGPRVACTYLEWELSKHPEYQKRLRTEVQTLNTSLLESEVPDMKLLDELPLLEALIMETLRLYVPTPGPQYRITPQGGTTLHGISIPGGTHISACFRILHENSAIFPNPDVWDPERWLTKDQKLLDEMRKWFWAFSKGSRTCIGKEYAMIVMKLIIAAIYSKYETDVVEEDGMEQKDYFLAGPVGEKLVLKFRAVS